MKIIVFGGSGFLGSYVADALTDAGHEVTIFDCCESMYLKSGQKMILGDITDQALVESSVAGHDVVYNFSAVADIDVAKENPIEVVKVNILGNTYILEAARKAGVQRFVYASSVYVYSQFGAFYSDSKLASEKLTQTYQRRYGLPFTILRYGSLYGPARSNHLSSINKFIEQAIREKKISYPGNGEEVREYIHVRDAAHLSVEILRPEFQNEHILITGNKTMRSRDLLMMVQEMMNDAVDVEFLNLQNREHYRMTGYSFQPNLARALTPQMSFDIGQGILELIEIAHRKVEPDRYDEATKHFPDHHVPHDPGQENTESALK